MKKIILVIFVLGFTGAKAQTNTFKINIIAPILQTANVQYERAFGNKSFQLGFFYTGYKNDFTKFNGYGITPEVRFYLSDTEAPAGFYVAPFIRYQSFNLGLIDPTLSSDKAIYSSIGGGAIIGKQWIFKKKVALDVFLGPSYNSGSLKVTSGTSTFDTNIFDGFGLRTGVCLGIAF